MRRAVELIDGEVYRSSPVYPQHALVHSEIGFQLRQRIDSAGLRLAVLAPVSVLASDHSLPQPDVDARQLHQLTDPTPEGYTTRSVIPFGARVVSRKVPEIALDTSAFG